MKWGTANPVMMRDPELGVVRVKAFGSYAFRVADPGKFLKEVAGTDWHFTTDEVNEHLRNQIVSKFAEGVATAHIPVFDLAANYSSLGGKLSDTFKPAMMEVGVEILNFLIENISLPEEVEAAIDKRSSMGAVGDLNQYTQYEAATSMEKAAENPGGMGAAGIGFGVGSAVGGIVQQAAAANQQPPAVPHVKTFYVAIDGKQAGPFEMSQLQGMLNQQLKMETLVWTAGMKDWLPASSVPEVASLFSSVPPPVPPHA